MNEETYRRLLDLVEAALELPPPERADFVARACDEDPAMLERAHRMLDAAGEPVAAGLGTRIEALIQETAASIVDDRTPYPLQIGAYTVTEVLGEGGMGVVLAARQSEPVSREVAIKLIRAGVHAPRIVERFHAERQTLATLEHPDIAKLFDAGTTSEGLPYFVMELIRGEPLTAYCDRRRLALAERLRIFRVLLGAVQHAHQKTIVHRDLKPSNVLVADVDGRPVLKVIDFGISRVASAEPGLTGLTGLGGGMGTIEYMSPEQVLHPARGADTRADVYSLGTMLHELVTGRLPHDPEALREASPIEREQMLVRGPTIRASRCLGADPERHLIAERRAADLERLARRVRGDLDTIIETAIAVDPAHRYASVARLDEDLGRFLDERPITARPPTVTYRMRKLVERNRAVAAGSALVIVLMVIMAIGFTRRLADERDRAQLEADKAQQVAAFLESLFEAADPAIMAPGDMTARELLDLGSLRIEDELAHRPDVQSSLFAVIGRTYSGLGQWEEAETYLARALALERSQRGEQTPAVAGLLEALGAVLSEAGHLERGDSVLRVAVDLRTALVGREHPSTAAAIAERAVALRGLGAYEEAESLARQAVRVLSAHPEADPLRLAHALHTLGFVLRSRASFDEAEEHYREALALRRGLLDEGHPEVLSTMNNLALTLEARGEYEEAESLLRELLEARRRRLGADHPITLTSVNNLAYMLWRTGQYPGAMERFEEAVALGHRIYGSDDNPQMAIMLNNLGVAQRRAGAFADSERSHRMALAMNERLFGRRHPRVAGDLDNLGRTLLAQRRVGEAEKLHERSLAIRTDLLGEDHPDRAESLAALGEAKLALGAEEEGLSLLEDALRVRSASLGADHPRTAQTLHDLGVALLGADAPDAAEQRLREALDVRRAKLGDEHPEVAATLTVLGRLLREGARRAEASAMLNEARTITVRRLTPTDPGRLGVERELALLGGPDEPRYR